MKRCTKCKRELSSSEFHKDLSVRDGLCRQCKDCRREYSQLHKEEIAKRTHEYYQAHKIEKAEYHRKYHQSHAEHRHQYYRSHKTNRTIESREYRKTHKEQGVKQKRAYRQAHPEIVRGGCQRYRARIRNNKIEKFADLEIFERDGWICQICGKRVNRKLKGPHPRSKSLDHIIPVSQGGEHTRKNTRLAHLGCNSRKQAKRSGQLRLTG